MNQELERLLVDRLFRPAVLIPAWVVLAGIALTLMLLPAWQGAPSQAVPRPVPEGDQEVVWLNQATNASSWERFVAALRILEADEEAGIEIVDDAQAFPSLTTAVPEIAVRREGHTGRIWFRWYKLTGDIDSARWVRGLMERSPPPLAIIGGATSDRARDLARDLNALPEPQRAPLLLITTATADQVQVDDQFVDLMTVFPRRSFRYCFTNQQMAEAVTDFLWQHESVRPDVEPVYLVHWNDDPFSVDLLQHFHQVVADERYARWLQQPKLARLATRQWAGVAARMAAAGAAPGARAGLCLEALTSNAPFWRVGIEHSIGGFRRPNRSEAEAADMLMNEKACHPLQRRPLLVLPAGTAPARRFLHALLRIAPDEASRFVVATGDFDFNAIYRDRFTAWPIQDLPVDLVLFSHRNPVDPVAFVPELPEKTIPGLTGKTTTATMDLLLYRDIAESVIEAAYDEEGLLDNAEQLRRRLRRARLPDGQPRFDDSGNLRSGTGEFVVWLRPLRNRDQVLPRAALQVWNRSSGVLGAHTWEQIQIAGKPELIVDYRRP